MAIVEVTPELRWNATREHVLAQYGRDIGPYAESLDFIVRQPTEATVFEEVVCGSVVRSKARL